MVGRRRKFWDLDWLKRPQKEFCGPNFLLFLVYISPSFGGVTILKIHLRYDNNAGVYNYSWHNYLKDINYWRPLNFANFGKIAKINVRENLTNIVDLIVSHFSIR